MASWLSRVGRAVPWTALVVAVGVGLRLYHYLREPSMWHDEAALVLNVLGKGFGELLGPLFFAEAAPPLFLWVEKGVTFVLGDGTYALRLVPFLASCATLFLLVPAARRFLHPAAVPWAMLLVACSDHLLWHTCEAKPYAVDVLAAATLVATFAATGSWPLGRRLALFGFLAPCLIFLVYPGVFLCGGLLAALLPAVWRARRSCTWLGYALLAWVVGAAFALLLAGPIHAQRCRAMEECWASAFPAWERPATVPWWTVLATFEIFRYCSEPIGQTLLPLAVLGAVRLWRRGQESLVVFLLTPLGLALVAGYLRAYPYGGSRVLVYMTPALALLIGEGTVGAFGRLAMPATSGRASWLSRAGVVLLAALLLAPFGRALQRVAWPWDRADCAAAARYVLANRRPGEDVASNHWEYAYYFRNLGRDFTLLEWGPHRFAARLWLVATAIAPGERWQVVEHLAPGHWQILKQHDFARTTVFLLARASEDPGSEGPRTAERLSDSGAVVLPLTPRQVVPSAPPRTARASR